MRRDRQPLLRAFLSGLACLLALPLLSAPAVADEGKTPRFEKADCWFVVPKGKARIRVQVSAAHTRAQLDRALDAFRKVGKKHGLVS